MLSIIIPTHDDERALVATLAALVSGVTAGLVRDVVIADAGSQDGTAVVADAAGCELVVSKNPLGERLAAAARRGRGDWLLFLRPGIAPEAAWTDEAIRFLEYAAHADSPNQAAATFRAVAREFARPTLRQALTRWVLGFQLDPDRGLLIGRRLYDGLGGHRTNAAAPERELMRRVGRRHISVLQCDVTETAA